jgi:cytochrome P450
MICQYALGGGVEDPDRVVTAFEVVLTEYLGRLYQPAEPGTEEQERKRAEEALAYLREVVNGVLASAGPDGNSLVAALDAAGMSPARVRDTVLMTMLAAHHTTGVAVSWTLHLPAGTTIFYPFWAVHLNPRYWPDPEAFIPGRFTPDEIAGRPRHAYIPFGLGPRSCEGASLAMVEAELVLAILLRRFRFHPVPGHDVVPVERFVLWAADDIRMNLTPRS